MRKKILRFLKKYKSYHFLLFMFLIVTSCDEKYISLEEDSTITTEYVQQTFILNATKSTLPINPTYLNQDLSSRVYIGDVDDERVSYAIFEITSDIVSKYGLCDNSILIDEINSIDSVLFRIVFDSPIKKTFNYLQSINLAENEVVNNFDLEENIQNDNDIAFFNNYVKSYYFNNNSTLVFNEDDLLNHEQLYIDNTIQLIKDNGNILSSLASTNYKLDLNLTDYIDINSLCGEVSESFYILIEYIRPNTSFKENFDIVSSDHFYMDHHPSLIINYKKESTTDSLINQYNIVDINSDLSLTNENYISNIILLDDATDIEDELTIDNNNWDNNNLVIANIDENSDGYGTILGFNSGDFNSLISNTPVIPASDSLSLFDIIIDLNDDILSDSIIFYFTDIVFGYQNINNSYDIGEEYLNYGTDQCPDNLETGNQENPCAISASESLYNPYGRENNGNYDVGEPWDDLGLDWLQNTNIFGVEDEYETGCKSTTYPYGIGYGTSNEAIETYNEIINLLGGIDFYKEYFILNNGLEIQVCGQQFWNNPNPDEGVSSCSTCNINDPNGDNKNIDPSNDDWENVEGVLIGDYNFNGIWDEGEPLERNGKWDWIDLNGNNIFDITIDQYESFFDYGIDQLPGNYNIDETENNGQYDYGENFNDNGIDNLFSVQEEYYNRYGREGNNEVDIIDGDNIFSEYSDFGLDHCPNGYEIGDNQCSDVENQNGDMNFDDFNSDPNNDNYSSDNLDGTENNYIWDYIDENEDEEWNWIDENENSIFDWDIDTYEPCEYFSETENPLTGLFVVGENLYNLNLQNDEDIQLFDKPLSLGVEDIILWISKIEKIDQNDNKYKITISISSSISVSAFQFKLNHIPYNDTVPYLEAHSTQMFPLDFDDLNNNNSPDNGEINEEVKYISDCSLYEIPQESDNFFNNEVILSYGYGTKWNFYFEDMNDFLYLNDQSLFISEQQTYLTIYFDINSENHDIPEEGVGLNFSGTIGDNILIENFIPPQLVFDDTSELSIQIGPLINELLSNSNTIFQNQSDIINTIATHMELSLSSYSNNFSKVALDTNNLPRIDILYSE